MAIMLTSKKDSERNLELEQSLIEKVLVVLETLSLIDNQASPFNLLKELSIIDWCLVRRNNDVSGEFAASVWEHLVLFGNFTRLPCPVVCNDTQ